MDKKNGTKNAMERMKTNFHHHTWLASYDVDVDNNNGSSDNNVFQIKSHGVCWVSRERRVDRMKRLFGVKRKD